MLLAQRTQDRPCLNEDVQVQGEGMCNVPGVGSWVGLVELQVLGYLLGIDMCIPWGVGIDSRTWAVPQGSLRKV